MRKFTSLLMLLSLFVGTAYGQTVNNLGELSNDKVYTIQSRRENCYLLYHTDAPNHLSSTYSQGGHQMAFSKETKNFQFAIYKYRDQYFCYNLEAKKFVGSSNGSSDAISLVDVPSNDVEIRKSASTDFPFVFSTDRKGALNIASTSGCHGVINWKGGYNQLNDEGNQFKIEVAGDLTSDLKTQIENEISLVKAKSLVSGASNTIVGSYTDGAVAEVKKALDAYNNYKTEQTKQAVADAFKKFNPQTAEKVTLTEGDIFKIKSADNSRGYLVYSAVSNNGSEQNPWIAGADSKHGYPTMDDSNVYSEWAFVQYGDHKWLYNVQKKKFLKSSTTKAPALEFSDLDYDRAQFTVESLNDNRFALKYGSDYIEFSPGYKGNLGVRKIGNKNDIGSHFYFEKVNKTVDQSVKSEMESALCSGWKNKQTAILGWIGGYPATVSDELNKISTKQGIDDFMKSHEKVKLSEGYYYIKGNGSGNAQDAWYVTYDATDKVSMLAKPVDGNASPGIPQIWKFVACEDGYKLQSCNLNLSPQLAAAPAASQINNDFQNGNKFIFEDKGDAKTLIKNGVGKVLRAEAANAGQDGKDKYHVNYWDGEPSVVTWSIIPVEDLKFDVTVSAAGYATAYLPFDVELPQDQNLQAYTITNLTDANATMTSLTDIPGHCGVVLKGEAKKYSLTAKVKAISTAEGNLLKGTTFDTPIEGEGYILSNPQDGSGVGLYRTKLNCNANMVHITDNTATHFKNNAYKAYLPKQGAGVRFYGFDFSGDGTTGIENIQDAFQSNNANAVIYDLSGRRVHSTAKGGIYIVNGKKVVR